MKTILISLIAFSVLLQADDGRENTIQKVLELNTLMNSHDDFSVKCKMKSHTRYDHEALKKKYKEMYSLFAVNMQDSDEEFHLLVNVKDRKRFAVKVKQISESQSKLGTKRNVPKGELPFQITAKDKSSRAYLDDKNFYSESLSSGQVTNLTLSKHKNLFENEKFYGLFISFPFFQSLLVKDYFKKLVSEPKSKFLVKGNTIILTEEDIKKTIILDEKGYLKTVVLDMTDISNSIHNLDPMSPDTKKKDLSYKPVLKATLTFKFSEWSHEVNEKNLKVEISENKDLLNMDAFLNAKPISSTGPKIFGGRSAAGRSKDKEKKK